MWESIKDVSSVPKSGVPSVSSTHQSRVLVRGVSGDPHISSLAMGKGSYLILICETRVTGGLFPHRYLCIWPTYFILSYRGHDVTTYRYVDFVSRDT